MTKKEEYIEKYSKSRNVSKEEALKHKTVQEVIKHYSEEQKDKGEKWI